MRQIITENQLRNIIRECVEQALIEEGLVNNIWSGLTAGFKRPVQKTWNGIKNVGKSVTNSVKNAYNGAVNAVNNTGKRIKQGYQVQQNIGKINNLMGLLNDLSKVGIFSDPGTQNAVKQLWGALQNAITQNQQLQTQLGNGDTLKKSDYRNSFNLNPQQTPQQQPQQIPQQLQLQF